MKMQGTCNHQNNFAKEQNWRIHSSDFKTYYQGIKLTVQKKKNNNTLVMIN